MTQPILVFVLSSLLMIGPACGANRCTLSDGRIIYQDAPCPSSAQSATSIRPRDNSVSGMPLDEARRRSSAIQSTNPDEIIAIKCSRDWPNDFRMQAYCKEQQAAALRTLNRPLPTASPETSATIRLKCEKDWPDDYRMRAYCEQRQLNGAAEIRQTLPATSQDAQTIRTKCAKDWPDDFRMRAYCEQKQIEGLRQLGR